jgi:hypothetical protein
LPDGLFSNQKYQIWVNFGGPLNGRGLGMDYVGVFYDHLEYFMAIWYNLWPFVIVCGHLVYFSQFIRKSGNPAFQPFFLHKASAPDYSLSVQRTGAARFFFCHFEQKPFFKKLYILSANRKSLGDR